MRFPTTAFLTWLFLADFSPTASGFLSTTLRHLPVSSLHELSVTREDATTASSSNNNNNNNFEDFNTFEERNRDELNWLVVTTGKLIGDDALPVGKLNKSMVQQTHRCMRAWSRRSARSKSNAPHVVEQLLHRLIQEQHAGNPHVQIIDTRTYNVVIDAWSKSREDGAAKRAEDILLGMEKQYAEGNESVRPNRASFNNCIKAWVRNGSYSTAVAKSEALINYMADLHHRDPKAFPPPCRRGYNLLLYAYAHSGLPDAGERANAVLLEMQNNSNDEWIAPDINTYNLVIKTWGQGRAMGFESRAHAVFDQVLEQYQGTSSSDIIPNNETFNAILSCCIKSKETSAMNRIMDHLETMETMFHQGNIEAKPDEITVNSVLTALARRGELEQVVQLQNRMEEVYGIHPDTVSNNILIDGWSKSKRQEAPERALDILIHMEEQFKKGNRHVRPDNYSYTSVIDCFIKSNMPNAKRQAMSLLKRMKALHRDHGGKMPSTDCYNAVLNSLASARNADSAELALSILTEMESTDDTIPRPNRVTYNTCLKACRNGHTEYAVRAQELLARMVTLGEDDPALVPDSYTYAAVINVWGRSDSVDKAERVIGVMNQMISSYKATGSKKSKPNTHVFNAALNACAFTRYDINAKMDAFVITVSILILLQEYTTPDEVTYGTVLRACSNLLPRSDSRRDELVEKVFRKARDEGYVNDMVLTQLKFAASTPLFRELVGDDSKVTLDDLPRAWTKKVNRKGWRSNTRWTS